MAGFMRPGTGKWFFSPTIASSTLAPTAAEMGTATHLTSTTAANQLIGIEGFDSTSSFIEVETFASRQTLQLAGRQHPSHSTMEFLEDTVSNTIRTLLARDTTGFMISSPTGAVTAGTKVDVFPVQVGANTRVYSAGNEAARFRVGFAITAIPAQDIAILA